MKEKARNIYNGIKNSYIAPSNIKSTNNTLIGSKSLINLILDIKERWTFNGASKGSFRKVH